MSIAIIGGSGLTALEGLEIQRQQMQKTPYGEPSGPLTFGLLNNREIIFLPRHGNPHIIPPHEINYRANVWALRENGVEDIIAINAVGGITSEMSPGKLVIPDQLIDYTWSRQHTFFVKNDKEVVHVDFTVPYTPSLRQQILRAAKSISVDCIDGGTYGATQGPRLETAAEILRMESDGCDLVGMTGMPEAVLARELDLNYACISVVANWAAGKSDELISMESIQEYLHKGMGKVRTLLSATIKDNRT
ncbi:MAG: S-methyl-5'-thioinosine phosphorylase [Gammaproteobacteria bacterium]|jgi:5'-methylthioinosine phosphorylase